MSFHRRGWRVVATAVLVLLAAGCSIADIRRPVPTQSPPASSEPVPAAPAFRPPLPPDELRQMTVPVPIDYRQQGVEFVDAEHGYVLFICGPTRAEADPDCPAILLATSDGGRTWRKLRHPRPGGEHQMLLANGDHVVLSTGPDEWYASSDRGQTFVRQPDSPWPPEAVSERFHICCGARGLSERKGEGYRELPNQPPVDELTDFAYWVGTRVTLSPEAGRASSLQESEAVTVWVTGVSEGRPQVAVSFDGGKTWQRPEVLAAADLRLSRLWIELAPDDTVWLLGYIGDSMPFPQLWRSQGSDFVPVTAAGHPPENLDVAAIGGGLLVVSGPDSGGVVTPGHYNDLGWPLGDRIEVLGDGTLLSVDSRDDSIWLGPGSGTQRKWIKLVLFRT